MFFFYRFFKEVSGARGGLAVTVRVLSDVLHLKRLGSARVRRVRFFMECSRRRVRSVRRRRENVVVSSISVSCEYDALAAAYFLERPVGVTRLERIIAVRSKEKIRLVF